MLLDWLCAATRPPGRRGYTAGFQVNHAFVVTQGERSRVCLEELREFFGVGRLFVNRRHDNHKVNLCQYAVSKRLDLVETIIPFFREHPLRTSKRYDFEGFAACMDVIDSGRHRTREVSRDRSHHRDDESQEAQTRAHQNPQRPYARHPGHWMKIWSPLRGDA